MSLAAALTGGEAHAQAGRPRSSAARLGRGKCPPREAPSYGTVRAAYVHHTVSLNDYTPEEAPGIVLAICRYHRNSNGWNDIGYQALVDKYGVLYEGRAGGLDKPVLGANAQGFNAQSTGIASIGDNTAVGLSDTALDSLADYIRWKLDDPRRAAHRDTTLVSAGGATSRYPAGRRVRVPRMLGHRDTNSTACPGSALYYQLDDLRARVATGERAAGRGHLPDRLAVQAESRYGGSAVLGHAHGRRRSAAGGQAGQGPGAPRDGRWRTARRADHGRAGAWSFPVLPTHARACCAPPTPGTRSGGASFSPEQLLRLKPLVALAPGATTGVRGRRVRSADAVDAAQARALPGAPAAHPRRLPAVGRADGARARRALPSSFVPAYAAFYRVYVVARADAATGSRALARSRRARDARRVRDALPPLVQRVRVEPAAGERASAPCGRGCARRAAASGCPRTRRPARSAPARAARRGRSPVPSR